MSVYGKLINNTLTLAPRRLTIDECVVFNPTDAQYEAAGYLPVIYTPAPEAPEGYYAEPHWEEQDGDIVEIWEFVPNPEPDPESETYPAWDIHSSTSFSVGDRVTSEGTVYECIKTHNASWTRQPPNAEYWRTV